MFKKEKKKQNEMKNSVWNKNNRHYSDVENILQVKIELHTKTKCYGLVKNTTTELYYNIENVVSS